MDVFGFPHGQTHQPHNRFNLYHIDTAEVHLDSMNVQIFDPSAKALEPGLLHLCSRSLLFDSTEINTDMLKLKFGNL